MHAFAGCNTTTVESFDVESLFSHMRYVPRGYAQVCSLYEGHRIMVKVTGAKWSIP